MSASEPPADNVPPAAELSSPAEPPRDADQPLPQRDPTLRRTRKWVWLALAAVAFFAIIAVLPRLISSRWVYEPMLQRLHDGDFVFAVDAVDLYWLRPLRFRGITIAQREPEEVTEQGRPPLLQVREVHADRGLLGYVLSGRALGRLEIIEPVADFELLQEDGRVRELLRAIGGQAEGESREQRPPPRLDVAVAVRSARVVVRQAGRLDPLVIVPAFDLDVDYRSAGDEPWLHVEPTRLLDRVALTPELMQLGMEFAAPILARAAWLSGEVSADFGSIDIPLARPIEAVGTAQITFHSVQAGVSQPALQATLRRVARLAGREAVDEIVLADGTVVEVNLANRVVHHQGLKLGLPRLDPRLQMTSEGNVSLADRTLDLVLSIPIPVDRIARRDSVRELGVPMVRLPIQGELGQPAIQWTQLRGDSAAVVAAIGGQLSDEAPVTSAVIGALGEVAGGEADEAIRAAADALRELRQRRRERAAQGRQAEPTVEDFDELGEFADPDQPQPPDTPQPRRRPILDRLRPRR